MPAKEKKGQKSKNAMAKRSPRDLAKSERILTVGDLEDGLLGLFPAEDAEDWDHTGLLVGERSTAVVAVAVALDPTVSAIRKAARIGANVLLTHHPAYLDPPDSFAPADSCAISPGAGVWAAIEAGVALMDFHTALDVSRMAQKALPNLLGFDFTGKLACPLPDSRKKGYGQICKVPKEDGNPISLSNLAAKCTSVFGCAPKVWGNMASRISTAICATGSAGNVIDAAVAAHVDCLVCGEVKYHAALEAKEAGLSIIELGHDISEFPLTAVLAKAASDVGVQKESIVILDQSGNWEHPEAIRL